MLVDGESHVRRIFYDWSLWTLIISNLFTLILAALQHWSLTLIMFVYWCQSVIIGAVNFVRIWQLKNFSTENFMINNRHVEPTESTKRSTALFFAFHYGFFHFGYFVFIVVRSDSWLILPSLPFLLLPILAFGFNHFYSYFRNRVEDATIRRNIGSLMFFPYLRIIPMHLTIVFFGGIVGGIIPTAIFMLLKTFADAIMHFIEHKSWNRDPEVQKKLILEKVSTAFEASKLPPEEREKQKKALVDKLTFLMDTKEMTPEEAEKKKRILKEIFTDASKKR